MTFVLVETFIREFKGLADGALIDEGISKIKF
jgi:hypothetical protein